ncbi:hypothetical protein NQD34_000352, partial [Periophthalmus magnuspinnatus]
SIFFFSPGDKLCSIEDCIPWHRSVFMAWIYLCTSRLCVLRKKEGEELPVISVVRETETQLLPDVGNMFLNTNCLIYCQVTSINPGLLRVHILYVGSTPLQDRFRGTIR